MLYCPSCMGDNEDRALSCRHCGGDMSLQNQPHQLPVMTILRGRYLVGRVLGQGGFGITYVGLDLVLGMKVAIKEYYPRTMVSRHTGISLDLRPTSEQMEGYLKKGKQSFCQEAQAMAKFQAVPSIVNVTDFFCDNATAYIVMEHVEGESLEQWLNAHGPEKDFNVVHALLLPAMEALGKVHGEGMIHRDISPSNLMLCRGGGMKLLDFGAARYVNGNDGKTLTVLLKHGYAPFEQYQSCGKQGPWTDVYALCATMYKLTTGKIPPQATDRVMDDGLVPPSQLGVQISHAQEEVLLKGLAVKVADRYQSIEELGDSLFPAPEVCFVFHDAEDNGEAELSDELSIEEPAVLGEGDNRDHDLLDGPTIKAAFYGEPDTLNESYMESPLVSLMLPPSLGESDNGAPDLLGERSLHLSHCPHCMSYLFGAKGEEKCDHCGGDLSVQNKSHQLPVMTKLNGRYLVGKVLSESWSSITYVGLDLAEGGRVTVKEYYLRDGSYRAEDSLDVVSECDAFEELKELFLQEAEIMKKFRNGPGLVKMLDAFSENNTAYMVMEHQGGQDLNKWLKEHGPERDFNQVYAMLLPVMETIKKIHSDGIVHGGIMPDKLEVSADGQIKLKDLGVDDKIVKSLCDRSEDFASFYEDVSDLYFIRKCCYIPLIDHGLNYVPGPRTDVYSLCAVMYELMTGHRPLSSYPVAGEDRLVPPSELGAQISPDREKVLLKGLAVKPKDRIQTVDELMEMIESQWDRGDSAKHVICPCCMEDNFAWALRCRHCGGDMQAQNGTDQLPVMAILNGRYLVGKVTECRFSGITHYIGLDKRARWNRKVTIIEYGKDRKNPLNLGKDLFLQEAGSMKKIGDEPGLVKMLDVFCEGDTAYIVMEHLDGLDLYKWMEEYGPERDFNKVYAMLLPVMKTIKKIHSEGIVHGTITPKELEIIADGQIKLNDLGMHERVHYFLCDNLASYEEMYMSLIPDFRKWCYICESHYAQNKVVGPWTDVYSLCAVMYELMTGEMPQSRDNRLLYDNLPPPSKLGAQISPAQEKALLKGLALDHKDRIQTMDELIESLSPTGTGEKTVYCPHCMERNAIGAVKCAHCGGDLSVQNKSHQLPVMTELNGRYLVGKALDQNGYSITYIAWDMMEDIRVIMKEYFPASIASRDKDTLELSAYGGGKDILEEGKAIFLQEMETWAKLGDAPGTAKILDLFYENNTAYVVTEYLDSQSLEQWLKGRQPERNFNKAYAMLRPVMETLGRCHRQGVVHLDIDPHSIRISRGGQAKPVYLDLTAGAVKALHKEDYSEISADPPSWVSIEQLQFNGVEGSWTDVYGVEGSWTDVHSICAIMYKLMTGQAPPCCIDRLVGDRLVPPSKLGVQISHAQERALLNGLAVKPKDRIQTMDELMEAFDRREPSRREPCPTKPKKKKLLPIAAVVALAVGAFALFGAGQGEDSSAPQEDSAAAPIVKIMCGDHHTVGLRSDGTVVAAGENERGQCNVSDWTDIVDVDAGQSYTVGLRSDGTVVATDAYTRVVAKWTDIVAISGGWGHVVGLRSDGTVVAAGSNLHGECDISGWTDIVAVSAGFYYTVGLRANGTVIAKGSNEEGQCNVGGWTNVVTIIAGWDHTVALRSDGTVLAAGNDIIDQCDVSYWTDIVDLDVGRISTVGLWSDGTVITTYETDRDEIFTWTDIVAVSAGSYYTVGLRADGTVVATGENEYGQCDVSDWTDVIAISVGDSHTIGLRSDGTVLATGHNDYGQCDVSGW